MYRKRTYSQANTNNGQTQVARPFKRVRVTNGRLTPYGATTYVVPSNRRLNSGPRNVKKGMDTEINAVAIDYATNNTSHVYPLNLLAAGTGSWNRIGRLVQMKSLRIKIRATCDWNVPPYQTGDPSSALPMNRLDSRHLRMVIVYDKQPNGSLPQKGEIFQYKTNDGTETGYWNGFLSYDNMERFKILRDEVITFDVPPIPYAQQLPIGASGLGALETIQYQYPPIQVERMLDVYLKLNLKTNFKSESQVPTIADIATGALYVVFMTDNNAQDFAPVVVADGVARLRYLDQ